MWTVTSKAVCCRKLYSFLFSEYPCSSLISYQEFQQIVDISTHWPLSFPVARFRLCYLIGKHLNSTAGGGGGREKLKCGPHFVVIYWNHYCAMFISANFTAWQFSFYHVCTVTLVYASYPEISFMHFERQKNAAVNLMSSLFRTDQSMSEEQKTSSNCSLNLASWSVTSYWG